MVENAGNHCKIRLKSLPTLSDSDPRLQHMPEKWETRSTKVAHNLQPSSKAVSGLLHDLVRE